jgi:hypothetical protein
MNCCVSSVLTCEMVLLAYRLFVCIEANEPVVVLCLVWLLCSVDCLVDMGAPWYTGTSEVRLPLTCFCLRLFVDALSWYQHRYWLLVCFLLCCPVWYINDLICACLCAVTGMGSGLTCTPPSLLLISCLTWYTPN